MLSVSGSGAAQAFSSPENTVCVVGLGKIGLPLSVQVARHGAFHVLGADINPVAVEAINAGHSLLTVEEGLEQAVQEVVGNGRLRATTDTAEAVRQARVVLVIVPVGLTDAYEIDFAHIDAATIAVGAGLQPGSLVIFETTLPVGTTRSRLASLLESASGLEAGKDFSLAFSPERVYSGRIFRDLAAYPKVVGGIDTASIERAAAFYRRALGAGVSSVGSTDTAELVKLVETTYRDVNIALANEFALYAEARGLDIREVIAAANTQPFSHVHQPGLGVGGHCIPVYPYFLFGDGDEFRLPPLARAINDGMAAHGVDMLEDALGDLDGRTVLILGLTYRENVKEVAFSSARRIRRELHQRGARVLGHDPLLSREEHLQLKVEPVEISPPPAVDAVVIQAYHDAYRTLDWQQFSGMQALLDGRAALSKEQATLLESKGIRYLRVGLGSKPGWASH